MSVTSILLCDLNIGNRSAVCRQICLALEIASRLNCAVVAWKHSPLRGEKFSPEKSDLIALSELIAPELPVEFLSVSRFPKFHLSRERVALLMKMLFFALSSPRKLSQVAWRGHRVGKWASESQRRRTLRVYSSRFPVRPLKLHGYPQLDFSSNPIRRFAQWLLPHFAYDAWRGLMFWEDFLQRKDLRILGSLQMHLERAEFQPLTALLESRHIPIFTTLDSDSASVCGEARQRCIRQILVNKQAVDSMRETVRQFYSSDLELAAKSLVSLSNKRFFSRRYTRSTNLTESAKVDLKRIQLASKGIVVLLNAVWESLNHSRATNTFHSWPEFFDSIMRVAEKERATVFVKSHPEEHWVFVKELEQFLSQRYGKSRTDYVILDSRISLDDIAGLSSRCVFTGFSTTAFVEAYLWDVPFVLADNSEYDFLSGINPPNSVSEFESNLLRHLTGLYEMQDKDFEGVVALFSGIPTFALTDVVVRRSSTLQIEWNKEFADAPSDYLEAQKHDFVLTTHAVKEFLSHSQTAKFVEFVVSVIRGNDLWLSQSVTWNALKQTEVKS